MSSLLDIAVLGAGSWGTALAKTLADKGHHVVLWGRSAHDVETINTYKENQRYLPGAPLPGALQATVDLNAAVSGKAMIVSVVPAPAVRSVWAQAVPSLQADALVVSASKGIENQTLATMEEVFVDVLPPAATPNLVFLSGPSFAREVGQRLPTALVSAARRLESAAAVQQAFATDRFRVYTSDDVVGVELGGALKNVMAIAAGVAEGLGFGHNTRAALITRGLAEITRLAVSKGAHPMTLAGLAGMGDLVLTCTGDQSRNRAVGLKLGQGKTLAQALSEMSQVAEGVKTTRSAFELGQKTGVELPITSTVYQILYEEKPALQAVSELLLRPMKPERG